MDSLELEYKFLNDNEDFALGFEVGRFYTQLAVSEEEVYGAYHLKNQEELLAIVRHFNYEAYKIIQIDETFFTLGVVR